MSGFVDRLLHLPTALVLGLVFLVPALESSMFVGIVFPGEIVVLLGGVLASQHHVSLLAVIAFGSLGAIVGDSVGYEVGRRYGDPLLARMPKRLVRPEHVARTKELLRRRGGAAVFIGRFTAALRVLVPGLAGVSGLGYRSFLAYNVAGAVAWATETAVVGYLAGASYKAAEHRLSLIGFGVLGVIVAGFAVAWLRRRPWVRTRVDARLDPTRWTGRPLTLLVVGFTAAAWLFVGVTQDVLGDDGIAAADPRLHRDALALRTGWLTPVAKAATVLGSSPVVYAALLVVVIVLVRHHRRVDAAIAAAALLTGQAVRHLVSTAVARPRPPRADWLTGATGYAWPSGHSASAVLALGLIVALLWPLLSARWQRPVAVVAAGVLAAAVGASRVYLGVHWVSDVLGGWAFGACWLCLAVFALTVYRGRRPASTPAERPPVGG